MSRAYERFLSVLEEQGCKNGRRFVCPAHDDRNPSLSVSQGEGGRVLIKCHAGCETEAVVAALGLTLADLFDSKDTTVKRNRFKIAAAYDYTDEDGKLLFQVCRLDTKGFRQRRPDGNGGWEWNLKGARRVLYRLPDLLGNPQSPVFVLEGEKDADRLATEGLIATTNPFGAGKWRKEYGELLKGRDVVIIPDNDEPGRSHAQQVARSLQGLAQSVKVIELPGLPEGGDVSDWLGAGNSVDELKALAETAQEWHHEGTPAAGEQSGERVPAKQESQADRLVNLVIADGIELFQDDLGDAFARVSVRDHREVWHCRSRKFRYWLSGQFWQSEAKALNSDALSAALNVIEAKGRFEGEEYPLHNRVAFHEGAIWYDLADRDWRAVRVTANGWEIVAEPPILFRRYSHQRPQPEPARGGDLHHLLHFVNLRDPSQGLLLLVYVVSCLIPDIPHPIPVLHGPQGSAKTTLFRMLRRLIDPSAVPVLSFPRDATELVQQLSHHWTPFYDNITRLPDWTSDMLCRAVTNEGFSKRQLYSDDEDVIYQFRRCVGLNGVNVAAHKPDLLDRCILFGLRQIAPSDRKPEKVIWAEFEEARPRLLGAIFDTLSHAMAVLDSIRLSGLPRMADFALWGCAVAEALGHSQDEFMRAYELNAEARNEEALQASPVAAMVMELMGGRSEWEGTPSELLAELEALAGQRHMNTGASMWPKAAHALSRRLNEVMPNLAAAGIEVAFRRDGRHRRVTIRKVPENSVTSVTTVADDGESLDLAVVGDGSSGGLNEASPTASRSGQPSSVSGKRSDAHDAYDATSRVPCRLAAEGHKEKGES